MSVMPILIDGSWWMNSNLYKLPGHVAQVLEVDFHPTEPVIVSCGIDKNVYLGEIIA
jgi:WD40 repeat protein